MYSVHCTLHIAQCTVHSAQCTVHSAQCTTIIFRNIRKIFQESKMAYGKMPDRRFHEERICTPASPPVCSNGIYWISWYLRKLSSLQYLSCRLSTFANNAFYKHVLKLQHVQQHPSSHLPVLIGQKLYIYLQYFQNIFLCFKLDKLFSARDT